MDLKEIDAVDPTSHWYYQSKLAAVARAIARNCGTASCILDVGAGSGFFTLSLCDSGSARSGLCIDPNYDTTTLEARATDSVRFATVASRAEIRAADVILLIDVLEHVDDDEALLRSYTDTASPGTLILIAVPAFMSLWSGHDDFLEHRRRYRLGQVDAVARSVGLDVVSRSYLFRVIFPLAWLVRRIRRRGRVRSDLRPVPPAVNILLRGVTQLEHRFGSRWVPGLSAFVVARVR